MSNVLSKGHGVGLGEDWYLCRLFRLYGQNYAKMSSLVCMESNKFSYPPSMNNKTESFNMNF